MSSRGDEAALLDDPEAAAQAAGLRYVDADDPGIRRRRRGRGFSYTAADGERITDRDELARIRALAVPPAWTDVWICPDARGHIQATGRDARGRKQYRYHARWRAVRDAAKFDHLIEFAEALPRIRRRVDADLRRRGVPRRRVLAAVVRLLDLTLVRVGNPEYARDNESFGLTTLRERHVAVAGPTIEIDFRGKSGKRRHVELGDARLARVVARCQELPGQRLFTYRDEDGEVRPVDSGDVNDYLRAASGRDVTSKDFRTWGATVVATLALREQGPRRAKTRRRRCVTAAVEQAAAVLGNTPAVCRRAYVHPVVVDCYLEGTLCEALSPARRRASRGGLDPEERMVLRFLRGRRDAAAPSARGVRRARAPTSRLARGRPAA